MSPSSRSGGPAHDGAERATDPEALGASQSPVPAGSPEARASDLVAQLVANFKEQVGRSLDVVLDDSQTSLAFVDHYLSLARKEDREPIVALVASGAGAYFGELIREHLGATWIGDGRDPRRLRLLLRAQFIHFSPVDQAYEAIAGHALEEEDPRLPTAGAPFDPAFGLRPTTRSPDDGRLEDPAAPQDDASWLEARIAELPPVPEDEFHSLTCRFETLQLMLELLAAKQANEGRHPAEHGIDDYLAAFAGAE